MIFLALTLCYIHCSIIFSIKTNEEIITKIQIPVTRGLHKSMCGLLEPANQMITTTEEKSLGFSYIPLNHH